MDIIEWSLAQDPRYEPEWRAVKVDLSGENAALLTKTAQKGVIWLIGALEKYSKLYYFYIFPKTVTDPLQITPNSLIGPYIDLVGTILKYEIHADR